MCFRFIFVRWRDKSVLISESIDDSDMSASENQVVVISCWGPMRIEAMRVRAVMKNRLLWKSGIRVHYYASLKDVIHTTTRGPERCLLALLYWQAAMLQWWLNKLASTYMWDVWGTLKKKSLVDFHLCYDNWFEIPRWNTMLKLF